jgi:radical SAM protein with 4Fe4S-binding SPASM domain
MATTPLVMPGRETDCRAGMDGAVIDAVWRWGYDNHVPLSATLEMTRACNLRCVHCYNRDRSAPGGAAPSPGELSFDEIRRLFAALRSAGCLFLGLTGGEPMAHPRFFDVVEEARRLHLAVTVQSNGTLATPEDVERLADASHLLSVCISLYGATAAAHDGVTGVAGSFDRSWATVQDLRRRGVDVLLKFIVLRRNAHEAGAMIESAESRGILYYLYFCLFGRYDGTRDNLAERVSPAEAEALFRGPLRKLAPDGTPEVTEATFPCNCARTKCAVSATGDVYPCIAVPWAAGNIRERPFESIWRDAPAFRRIRGLRMADYPQCGPCELKAWCFRDRGTCYLASGDYTGIDPWMCEVAAAARRAAISPCM